MICEAGLELHARCQATPLSLPDPCDRQLLTRVPFPPTPGLGTSFSFTLPELPSLTHCSHGPAPASLLWGPSVDAVPGAPGPHLGHTWATPGPGRLPPYSSSLSGRFAIRDCVFYIYRDQLTCLAESGGEGTHPMPSKSFVCVHSHVYRIPCSFSVAAVTNDRKLGDWKQTENHSLTVPGARSPN